MSPITWVILPLAARTPGLTIVPYLISALAAEPAFTLTLMWVETGEATAPRLIA